MSDALSDIERMPPAWVDFFIMVGVFALVAVGSLIWFLYLRKKWRWHRHKHRHHHSSHREPPQKNAGEIEQLAGKHRHRRRREHRPINPTLAQTGGLPPIRSQELSNPTPPPTPRP